MTGPMDPTHFLQGTQKEEKNNTKSSENEEQKGRKGGTIIDSRECSGIRYRTRALAVSDKMSKMDLACFWHPRRLHVTPFLPAPLPLISGRAKTKELK
ncbi:hypothetical protein AVEN_254093-1 [Araneus ventricosus]|uniref:Uncharacterized protein n=1 Tax=Araneus ventricosus TaxID=182803 RepID=A0A4Y2BZX6_ARAVE|nr:hypothetical protein AVEN_254093-1 [Araneus ventricosus]